MYCTVFNLIQTKTTNLQEMQSKKQHKLFVIKFHSMPRFTIFDFDTVYVQIFLAQTISLFVFLFNWSFISYLHDNLIISSRFKNIKAIAFLLLFFKDDGLF
jgi:hypothetical protein